MEELPGEEDLAAGAAGEGHDPRLQPFCCSALASSVALVELQVEWLPPLLHVPEAGFTCCGRS